MICVIDNFDSFTYNLVQILQKNKLDAHVFKNNEVSIEELQKNKNNIKAFLLSPGPGHPRESGVCPQIVHTFHATHPILGVCLGHQILADYFGAHVATASEIYHGKTSLIYHHQDGIYKGLSMPFEATRYHSLVVRDLPPELIKTSWTQNKDGHREIMGFRHREYMCEGVQFHPESILTTQGEQLVLNFFRVSQQED